MDTRKRMRVQAQRKFAQGVNVPTLQNIQISSAPPQAVYPKVQSKVDMTCSELLDHVSFRTSLVENTRHLVVVIEKFDTQCPRGGQAPGGASDIVRTKNGPGPSRDPSSKRLGSRDTNSRDREVSPRSSPMSPKHRRRSSSVTDTEENRPLQFLSQGKGYCSPPMIVVKGSGSVSSPIQVKDAGESGETTRLVPVLNRRVSDVSTAISSLPLAYLKAQRQGIRKSLRQMQKRNTPGVKKPCSVAKKQKKPKKSRVSRKKGVTRVKVASTTSAESAGVEPSVTGPSRRPDTTTDNQKRAPNKTTAASVGPRPLQPIVTENSSTLSNGESDTTQPDYQMSRSAETFVEPREVPERAASQTPDCRTSGTISCPRASTSAVQQNCSTTSGEKMLLEAPVFKPNLEEMLDFKDYLNSIESRVSSFGICKIVPPKDFQPPCYLKNVSFRSSNQCITTMQNRWAPVVREMTAIKAHLTTLNVTYTRPPLFEGIEVDLVKLNSLVYKYGGLVRVMENNKWGSIAEEMRLNAERHKAETKLDKIYIKFLLPYQVLTTEEREYLLNKVDTEWKRRFRRMEVRASQPLLHIQRSLDNTESSDEDEPVELRSCFAEIEECIVPGPKMNLDRFKKIGEQIREIFFPKNISPDTKQVESSYWRLVSTGDQYTSVYGASLDTSQDKLGFPDDEQELYGSHPWNLKHLGSNPSNMLSFLGKTLAVNIPTLHLGMMFSTNCWHMDPHHLPWTEYMHQGSPKIWYGISSEQSDRFRQAMKELCPTAVQNKSIWLPSDTAMVPPEDLMAKGVQLTRVLQHPGEYIIVLPKAYCSSISTGYTVSESLYFASQDWLRQITPIFKELQQACEPSMFSAEELLVGIIEKQATKTSSLLRSVSAAFKPLYNNEMKRREDARILGIPLLSVNEYLRKHTRSTQTSWQVKRGECELCRCTLYWSKVLDRANLISRTALALPHINATALGPGEALPSCERRMLGAAFLSQPMEELVVMTREPLTYVNPALSLRLIEH